MEHLLRRLRGWDVATFSWVCACGQVNDEPLPEGGIDDAFPGDCAAVE